MITCPKCNKELNDDVKFCDGCGAKIYKTIFCPKCGKQTSTEFAFCQSCGASITDVPVEARPAALAEKKKFPKKTIIFGGIGVALAVVLILVISLMPSGSKAKNDFALYLKDSEALQLTSGLDDSGLGNTTLVNIPLGACIYMSEDGKYIFFPNKIIDNYWTIGQEYRFDLYYREIGKPESEAIMIDSDVQSYTVNTSTSIVTYLKGEEGSLYQYKLADDSKDKIASEVKEFNVSDDGTKIAYINSEGSFYRKSADNDKEKIASEVSSLEYLSNDLKTAYYIKEDSLYKQVEGEDSVKIASNVYDVIKIYETGEIYYLTSEDDEISLMDYVIDDMKDADDSMIQPSYPNYPKAPIAPSWWDYGSDVEYNAAYEAYEDAYEAWKNEYDRMETEYSTALETYWAKATRDELRTSLEGKKMERPRSSLCFYNGTETTVITDALGGAYKYSYGYTYKCTYASDEPVIIYEVYNQSNLEKVKLSEVKNIYDLEGMVEAALVSSSDKYIAVKDNATLIEQVKEAKKFQINSSGTVVYYLDNIPDEKDYGDLYRISISNGVVGKAELYDNNVYTGFCCFVGGDNFQYYKDCKDYIGELYINKTKIDHGVDIYYVGVSGDFDRVIYFTDRNADKAYGTLKIYQDGKIVETLDDVYEFYSIPGGRILYLYDYNLNYHKGELYMWENGETRKIDDDVYNVVPVYEAIYRSYDY